jgi:hypothetical protein
MGGGEFCSESYATRAETSGYHTKHIHEIFTEREINEGMSPHGLMIRESRDSDEHPNSLSIIFALDTTGSMGNVPAAMIRDGLPQIMGNIIQRGEKDPQVCFVGVGDHECDSAPLQVGQFESSDELLEKWLKVVYLEGGGGGNGGESYPLAWYFAAYHTSIDCWKKRKRKGFLFTVGDEPPLKSFPATTLKKLFGVGQYKDHTADELYAKASEMYHVFHIHTKETLNGGRNPSTINGWKEMLGNNLIVVDHHKEIPAIVSRIIYEMSAVVSPVNSTRDEDML